MPRLVDGIFGTCGTYRTWRASATDPPPWARALRPPFANSPIMRRRFQRCLDFCNDSEKSKFFAVQFGKE